jgi:predicted Fe-S protein YdhL (DUF1289 family)
VSEIIIDNTIDRTPAARPSPCVGICSLDPKTDWCIGCGRSRQEIAGWRRASPQEQDAILARLPERRQTLAIRAQPLPLDPGGAKDFLVHLAGKPDITWVMGVTGGIAEYCSLPGEALSLERTGDGFSCHTAKGGVRIALPELARVFHIGHEGVNRFCLAMPPHAPAFPEHAVIRELGPDEAAIREGDRAGVAFDLGLGHWSVRFLVRSVHEEVIEAMRRQDGVPLLDALLFIMGPLLRNPVHRIAETALGRVEVYAPIADPNGASPTGPHTHILPDLLKEKRGLTLGQFLPRTYGACCSVFAGRSVDLTDCMVSDGVQLGG